MSELSYIKTVGEIPIYADPYMDRDSFMVMYEKFWLPPGMVLCPFDPTEYVGPPEVDYVQKKKDKKLSDVKGIICNCPEEDVDKIIQALYKEFKP